MTIYLSPSGRPRSAAHGNINGHANAGAAHAPQYNKYPHFPNDSYSDNAITTPTDAIQHALYFKMNHSACALDGFVRASHIHRAPTAVLALRFVLVCAFARTGVTNAYDDAIVAPIVANIAPMSTQTLRADMLPEARALKCGEDCALSAIPSHAMSGKALASDSESDDDRVDDVGRGAESGSEDAKPAKKKVRRARSARD